MAPVDTLQPYTLMTDLLNFERFGDLRGGDPQQPVFAVVELKKGKHVLAAVSGWQEYPKWTQVSVRTADGFLLGTSGDWKLKGSVVATRGE